VIAHQIITFGCDHGELECVVRLVYKIELNLNGVDYG